MTASRSRWYAGALLLGLGALLLVWGLPQRTPTTAPGVVGPTPESVHEYEQTRVRTADDDAETAVDPPPAAELGPVALIGVVSDVAGRPIAGATVAVRAGERRGAEPIERRTDDAGEVAFRAGEIAGVDVAVASAPGHVLSERTIAGASRIDFTLRAGGALRVRVVDRASGNGVPSAHVAVRGGPYDARVARQTDLAGAAVFEGLDMGRARIVVVAPGFSILRMKATVGAMDDALQLELDRGSTVYGTVTRAGAPVGGARVWRGPLHGLRPRPVITDAAGRYEVGGFSGKQQAVIAEDVNGARCGRWVTLPLGHDRVRLDIDLGDAFVLLGRVTGGGEPLAGAAVSMASAPLLPGERRGAVLTDADGVFRFPTRVFARRPGILKVSAKGWAAAYPTVPGDAAAELVIDLEAAARVVGRVVSEGRPLPTGYVSLDGKGAAGTLDTTGVELDGEGRFEFETCGGTFTAQITGRSVRMRELKGLELEAGQTLDLGTIELEGGERITGVVRERDGTPVAGMNVEVVPEMDPLNLSFGWTAADGVFRVAGLPSGLVTLRVGAPGWREAVHASVPAGTSGLVVVLERANTVLLHVQDVDGSPAPLFAYDLSAGEPGLNTARTSWLRRGESRGGRAVFSGLVAGLYTFTASSGGAIGVTEFTVDDHHEVTARVALVAGIRALGDVSLADGRAAPDAIVRLLRVTAPAQGQRLETMTDDAGHFDLGGVMPGEWTLTVEARGVPTRRRTITIDDSHRTPLREQLALGGSVGIRVVGATPEVVQGCRLELRDAAGARVSVRTRTAAYASVMPANTKSTSFGVDEYGMARAELVDPGDYVLDVRTTDGHSVTREVAVRDGRTVEVAINLD